MRRVQAIGCVEGEIRQVVDAILRIVGVKDQVVTVDGKVVTKSEPEKNPLIEKYDKNGDGKLDREEMQAAMASMTDEEKKKMREQMMKRSGGRKGGSRSGGGGSSRRGSRGPR